MGSVCGAPHLRWREPAPRHNQRGQEKPTSNEASCLFRPPAVPRSGPALGGRIDAVAAVPRTFFMTRVEAGIWIDDPIASPGGGSLHVSAGTPNPPSPPDVLGSDLGKTIETAAYSLYRKPNPELEAKIDAVIDMYGKLQQPDGYLSSWYLRIQPGKRWANLRDCHELYCAGHLIEGAVAYFEATGKRKLLDIMARYVDHIASSSARRRQAQRILRPEELALAAWKLARATGERQYRDLANYFIDQPARKPHI